MVSKLVRYYDENCEYTLQNCEHVSLHVSRTSKSAYLQHGVSPLVRHMNPASPPQDSSVVIGPVALEVALAGDALVEMESANEDKTKHVSWRNSTTTNERLYIRTKFRREF
jgi:hypothetical protein